MNVHPAIYSMRGERTPHMTPTEIEAALNMPPVSGGFIYYRGNLAEACGVNLERDCTREELAARATRRAAWEAYQDGRAILTQRRVARDVCDYLITVRA
jgi:hypothetical protein